MRDGRGVGDLSRLRRVEFDLERETRSRLRRTLSFDFERRSEDPRRFPSPSFSFESTFRPGLRLLERDGRRLRRSPPLLDDEDDDELE